MIEDWILGTGPSSAQLMIIGEAPGQREEELKRPFVGPSGELVTELLETAGSSRSQVYITNVVKIRPPQNDLERLGELGYKIEDFLPLLWKEIEALQPNCILALGSLACKTLTGKDGIKSYRGSILPSLQYGIKTIPTIHPAALFERPRDRSSGQSFFTWKQKPHIQFDFIKAVRESQSPSWDSIPRRSLRVIRSSIQLEQFFSMYKDYKKMYVDTEVFKSHLVCIGFAFTRYEGVSIPLIDLQSNDNPKGIPLHELIELWKIVQHELTNPERQIVGQNWKADKVYWLETAGFDVGPLFSDGMFLMHTLSPELPKSLAFQASIFTNETFWKSEGKEYNPHKDKIDDLLLYNAKDCCLNCECVEEMEKDLKELGLEDFYYNFVMPMYEIYEGIEKRGILVDKEKKKDICDYFEALIAAENERCRVLLADFGIEQTVDKKGRVSPNYNSPKQVHELIYGLLRCPQRKDTADETLTALMNNAVKDSKKKSIIKSVLERRSLHKLKETYAEAEPDFDGRMRCTYNQVGTETGRTSTGIIKKPLRNGKWGAPFQTIPRADETGGNIRSIFIPDPGKVLIEPDQSQAEARIVALLAEDDELLALYDILDVHKLTASFCYGLSGSWNGPDLIIAALKGETFPFLDLVTDEQRQVGKNTRHGLAYDEGIEGLAIKQKISVWRAKQTYQKVHEMSPKIKGVYHESIQEALGNSRVMITPFGRRREFFERWGQQLFREAYASYPQSVVGDNTKRCMLALKKYSWIEMLMEGHDSFLAQIPEERLEESYWIVKENFEQEIDFSKGTIKRKPIIIPVGFKWGYNWGEMKKVKF